MWNKVCYTRIMPDRTRKRQDINQRAADIVAKAADVPPVPEPNEPPEKNPAAVILGRLGGKKGGKARAAKLTAQQRSDIARKAAQARWSSRS